MTYVILPFLNVFCSWLHRLHQDLGRFGVEAHLHNHYGNESVPYTQFFICPFPLSLSCLVFFFVFYFLSLPFLPFSIFSFLFPSFPFLSFPSPALPFSSCISLYFLFFRRDARTVRKNEGCVMPRRSKKGNEEGEARERKMKRAEIDDKKGKGETVNENRPKD